MGSISTSDALWALMRRMSESLVGSMQFSQGLHVGLGLHNQRADPSRTAAVDEGASLLFRYANDDGAVVRNAFDRLAAGTGAMAAAA